MLVSGLVLVKLYIFCLIGKKVAIWTPEFVGKRLWGVGDWLDPGMKKSRKMLTLRDLAEFFPDEK